MPYAPNETTTGTDIEPLAGRPAMDLPGAGYPKPASDPDADLRARLGEVPGEVPGEDIVAGETDLLPDVEVPAGQM